MHSQPAERRTSKKPHRKPARNGFVPAFDRELRQLTNPEVRRQVRITTVHDDTVIVAFVKYVDPYFLKLERADQSTFWINKGVIATCEIDPA